MSAASRSTWIIILLAAGFSRRMDGHKLLLPAGKESMLRHVANKALRVRCAGVLVVLNPHFPQLERELNGLPAQLCWNEVADLGISSSIRSGIEHLPETASAAVILLADQPKLDPAVVERLLEHAASTGASIVQAAYQGQPGHPVLFGRSWFPELKRLTGDRGAKALIRRNRDRRALVDVGAPPLEDVDTEEDYVRVIVRGGEYG